MARLIQPLSANTLNEFERCNIQWPMPFLQQAWLAILFWMPTTDSDQAESQHYVWFLKLPLDEQAKLNLVARDDFLRRMIEALSQSSGKSDQESLLALEQVMKDNPYGFQPKQEQLANFHAMVHKELDMPVSKYFQDVQNYFLSDNLDNWSELGFQGFADLAARLNEKPDNNQQLNSFSDLLTNNIHRLPLIPFQALGQCLEHHHLDAKLEAEIVNKAVRVLTEESVRENQIAVCVAALHALSLAEHSSGLAALIWQILNSEISSNIEILATISGRCWLQLQQPQILHHFLEALAHSEQGQGAFNAIIADLMYIPGMREFVLEAFRAQERSDQLSQAIGAFFAQLND
jgi:hypothetical protein